MHLKLRLEASGFAEKAVEFDEDASSSTVMDVIYENYPKLKSLGGIEFLRVAKSSRQFTTIPPGISGFEARYLKRVINNGKLFLRPIQKAIDLNDNIVSVTYKC